MNARKLLISYIPLLFVANFYWVKPAAGTQFRPIEKNKVLWIGKNIKSQFITHALKTNTEDSVPIAAFTADPIEGATPLTVNFSNNSLNGINYFWSFGDGDSSSEPAPSHIYAIPGDYSVTLVVANNNSSDTLTKSNYITVDYPKPKAEFSAQLNEGVAPLEVEFTNLSENATTWQWDFGDGSTSIEQNPSHTYNQGVFTVSLLVTNPSGNNFLSKSNLIVVNPNGIDESVETRIRLFPNPAFASLSVEFANEFRKVVSFEVIDTGGRVVKNITPIFNGSYNHEISVQDLAIGNYLLQINFDNGKVLLVFSKE